MCVFLRLLIHTLFCARATHSLNLVMFSQSYDNLSITHPLGHQTKDTAKQKQNQTKNAGTHCILTFRLAKLCRTFSLNQYFINCNKFPEYLHINLRSYD